MASGARCDSFASLAYRQPSAARRAACNNAAPLDRPRRAAVFDHVRGARRQMEGDVAITGQPGLLERGIVDAVDV